MSNRSPRPFFRGCATLALASLTVAGFAGGCAPTPPSLTGQWDASVTVDGVDIPFRFDLAQTDTVVTGSFPNGDETISSTGGTFTDDRLVVEFDHYASRIEAVLKDGQLEGKYDRGKRAPFPFKARPHVAALALADVPSIDGLWHIAVKSNKGEAAWRLIVRQAGAEVSGAILRIDGDTGTLSGSYADGKFTLSHFSGARPLLLEATLAADGSLQILRNRKDTLVAVRQEVATAKALPAPTDPSQFSKAKDPSAPFTFSAPALDGGAIVSNTDDRFRGKVVIVSVTGTWCPNCHDEAPFLSDLYRKYRSQGLEIVALSFEEADQLENPVRARAFVKKYGIEYPMLLVGTPDQAPEQLSQIENLNSFPTTVFLGRDGRIRAIHAGFASSASGTFHQATKDDIRNEVERLLAETN